MYKKFVIGLFLLLLSIFFFLISSLVISRENYISVDQVLRSSPSNEKVLLVQGELVATSLIHTSTGGTYQFRIKSSTGKSLQVIYIGCCIPENIYDGTALILKGNYTVENRFVATSIQAIYGNIRH